MNQIPLHKVFMSKSVDFALKNTLHSGYIGEGPRVEEFEEKLGNYLQNPNVVAVNSCTSGLHLALEMLSFDPLKGDDRHCNEILTTPLTCLATNTPIVKNGYNIKWVDVNPKTCNMDLEDLTWKLSKRTRAVLVTHWGGTPVDMDEVSRILWNYWDRTGRSIPVIEDCAHAFGAEVHGKKVGALGNTSVFSFGPIKNLTCGDGGLISFPSYRKDLSERAKKLRWYGIDRKNRNAAFDEVGHKFHMNDIAAAIGIENLKEINGNLKIQHRNASLYHSGLADVSGLTLLEDNPSLVSSYWLFTVLVDNRDRFIQKMKEHGVECGIVHRRNDQYDCMKDYYIPLAKLDSFDHKRVCIPVGWWLTEDDVQYIINSIKKGW